MKLWDSDLRFKIWVGATKNNVNLTNKPFIQYFEKRKNEVQQHTEKRATTSYLKQIATMLDGIFRITINESSQP
jgi:hypothetical protein